ncbi:MAG: hypothetical protein HC784_16780 [Hydrococcus sp. CSU_1_8]|nr:hypothetical protein [Hydrococcus sp. CSU_1_8]
MQIIDANSAEVIKVPIGIGRGGLKSKRDMMDYVTPTGEFVVDLILYQQESFNQVSPKLRDRYLNSEFRELFAQPQGLKELFQNMNSLDLMAMVSQIKVMELLILDLMPPQQTRS